MQGHCVFGTFIDFGCASFETPPFFSLGSSCSAQPEQTTLATAMWSQDAWSQGSLFALSKQGIWASFTLTRLQNEQAGQLTNGDFIEFIAMERRLRFRLDDFRRLALAKV